MSPSIPNVDKSTLSMKCAQNPAGGVVHLRRGLGVFRSPACCLCNACVHCRSTIHLGQSKKKRMRDRVSCAKVELPHNNLAKGDHISHEQEYNTGHGIPAISHEVRRKIRRQPRQSEIQQEPVVHLLLEAALGWKCGIPCLSVQAASQPSKPAYGSRTETHPGHAPQKSNPGHD